MIWWSLKPLISSYVSLVPKQWFDAPWKPVMNWTRSVSLYKRTCTNPWYHTKHRLSIKMHKRVHWYKRIHWNMSKWPLLANLTIQISRRTKVKNGFHSQIEHIKTHKIDIKFAWFEQSYRKLWISKVQFLKIEIL